MYFNDFCLNIQIFWVAGFEIKNLYFSGVYGFLIFIISLRPVSSVVASYEDLELAPVETLPSEKTPLELRGQPRLSMKKLVRQQSMMDTQKTTDGTMQMTYWF